jgi:transposase
MQQGVYKALVTIMRGEPMQSPEDVAAMLRLHECGWGAKRIARELKISKNTVKRYLREGGWRAISAPRRAKALDGLEEWLKARFLRHRGNAAVVQQELKAERAIEVSLRTVERACRPYRQQLSAEARATVRFETPPGKQLQIDFGTKQVLIAGEPVRVRLFVATLGYSRRIFVQAFRHERQSAWLRGLEGAFNHFDGVPEQVLLDNAKALVEYHDAVTREVCFNERLAAFARYWRFRPKACAPYRARTKGKDERGVGYVKRNALAGRGFASWAALEAHLAWWMREVADERVHGTTGEKPIVRFAAERKALAPLSGRAPFEQGRELVRRVHADASVEVDTNRYSVPWRLIGETVSVELSADRLHIRHAGVEVASHPPLTGQRQCGKLGVKS